MRFPDKYALILKITNQVFFTLLMVVSLTNYLGNTAADNTANNESNLEDVATDVALKIIQDITNETAKTIENPSVSPDERISFALKELNLTSNGWQDAPYTYRSGVSLPLEVRIENQSAASAGNTSSVAIDESVVLIIRSKSQSAQDSIPVEPFEITSTFRISASI